MNKKEISEIKKQFTSENCALTRLFGCYVDVEKQKRMITRDAFLSLPEEEMFKYFEIFRKVLTGPVGKNLLTLEFTKEAGNAEGEGQNFLMQVRESRLAASNDSEDIVETFVDKVIESFDFGENYLILLAHGVYDVPGKGTDNAEMFDASDEVYEYVIGAICPVRLSKPGLSYDGEKNRFGACLRSWVADAPISGFLFPAFNDRSTDLNSLLYYAKNPEKLQSGFAEYVFGCYVPMSPEDQKETFHDIVEKAVGGTYTYDLARDIHENLLDMVEESTGENPPELGKVEMERILRESGIEDMTGLEEVYKEKIPVILAENVTDTKKYEIKTPDVTVKVKPDRTDLVKTQIIDGRQCLVIAMDDPMEVNGVMVKISKE